MLRWFKADLHIHTVLSPCAQLTMGPRAIVQKALEKKLDIIAITDHNSSENVQAVMEAAAGTTLTVIPGMEVSTKEGVHFICLFPNVSSLANFQRFVYDVMPEGLNDEEFIGQQLICDKDENIVDTNKRLLSLPINASMDLVIHNIIEHHGIIYPAHANRKSSGVLHVLGFMPESLPFKVTEIVLTPDDEPSKAINLLDPEMKAILASDAHDIEQIGCRSTYFRLARPEFEEIYLAINGQQGRCITIQQPVDELTNCEKAIK